MNIKRVLVIGLVLLIILASISISYGAEIIEVTSVRTIPNPATVKYPPGDSVYNNVWTRLYESKLGIRLKYLWAVDQSQWEQKTNIMIASGDLPDFFLASKQQFYQMLNAGLLEDLTDVYKKYASPQTKKVLMEHGPEPLASATFNGRLMAIPFTALAKEAAPILFIRSDWMKKLGLADPKNMKDVLKISKAFTEKDPDGNGKNDTFGIAVDKDFAWLTGFFNSYYAYPNIWIKDKSGKLVYGSIQPEVKTALKALQDMYKDGQIDPEFGTKDTTKVAESIAAGRIGIIYAAFWTPLWPLQDLRNRDPKAEWTPYPIRTIDGRLPKLQYSLPVNGYWVVRKGCKHPEALLKIMNLWVDIFYFNKSDEIWAKYGNDPNTGNEIWQNAHAQIHRAWKNLEQAYKVRGVLKGTTNISELTGDDKGVLHRVKKFLEEGDNLCWSWNKIYNDGGSFDVVDFYKKRNCYIMDQFYGPLTTNMIEKLPVLSKLQSETFTKVIKGTPIEEFDKFVEEWKRLGGDIITKEVNDWYTSRK